MVNMDKRCSICEKSFSRPDVLRRHIFTVHNSKPQEYSLMQVPEKLTQLSDVQDNVQGLVDSLQMEPRTPIQGPMALNQKANLKFQHPFTCTISAPTGGGKTYFVLNMLMHGKIEPRPERIIYVYKRWQPLYDTMKQSVYPPIEFVKGIPENIDDDSFINSNERNVIILDDMMCTARNDPKIADLFMEGSHHRNISVINLTQSLFPGGKYSTTQRRNSLYMVIFKSPVSQDQIRSLGTFMSPGKLTEFLSIYNRATMRSHGYLIVDAKSNTPPSQRFITNIFAEDQIGGAPPQDVSPQPNAIPIRGVMPPPGMPDKARIRVLRQEGDGIKATNSPITNHSEDSNQSDDIPENSNMDIRDITPCNYCGVVYDDVDNLQSHLHDGCSRKRKLSMTDEMPESKKIKLNDIDQNNSYIRFYNDAVEENEQEKRVIMRKYKREGMDENEANEMAESDLYPKYKKSFFKIYRAVLGFNIQLETSDTHKKLMAEILQLEKEGNPLKSSIKHVLTKYAYMFEDFLEYSDGDGTDDETDDETKQESGEESGVESDGESISDQEESTSDRE